MQFTTLSITILASAALASAAAISSIEKRLGNIDPLTDEQVAMSWNDDKMHYMDGTCNGAKCDFGWGGFFGLHHDLGRCLTGACKKDGDKCFRTYDDNTRCSQ